MGLVKLIRLVRSMSPPELMSLARARKAADWLEDALEGLSGSLETEELHTLLTAHRQQIVRDDGLTDDEELQNLVVEMTAGELAWLGKAAIAMDELETEIHGLNGRFSVEQVEGILTAERWRVLGLLWDAAVIAGADEVLTELNAMERIRPADRS